MTHAVFTTAAPFIENFPATADLEELRKFERAEFALRPESVAFIRPLSLEELPDFEPLLGQDAAGRCPPQARSRNGRHCPVYVLRDRPACHAFARPRRTPHSGPRSHSAPARP